MSSLINKYNIPGPRYTSYPTVPYWDETTFTADQWKTSVIKSFKESNNGEGISIYIHLPFCEALCTFCACHKRITKQHSVETPYLKAVLKEWELYLSLFDEKPKLKEVKDKILETLREEKLSEDPALYYQALVDIREEKEIKWKDDEIKKQYNKLMDQLIESAKEQNQQ